MFVDEEIGRLERLAAALEDRPLLRAAFASGGLSSSKVRELIREEAAARSVPRRGRLRAHAGCD